MFSLSSDILGIIISFASNRHGVYKAPSKPETMSAFVTESDLNGIGIRVVRRFTRYGLVAQQAWSRLVPPQYKT